MSSRFGASSIKRISVDLGSCQPMLSLLLLSLDFYVVGERTEYFSERDCNLRSNNAFIPSV
ncbi:hypothetical protein ACFLSI_00235 [Bacteroidota bacterium]